MTNDSQTQLDTLVGDADNAELIDVMPDLNPCSNNWMPDDNPFREDGMSVVKTYIQERKQKDGRRVLPGTVLESIGVKDFAQFLSSTAFLQCGDAWSLLGRATTCLLMGDVASSIHMLYYAELRGVMSLLAARGIYIGANESLILNKKSEVVYMDSEGTHVISWKALEILRKTESFKDSMRKMIEPFGYPLQEWSNRFSDVELDSVLSMTALDIQHMNPDHTLRNIVSYRPLELSAQRGADPLSPFRSIRSVISLWGFLEPNEGNVFQSIDNNLLCSALAHSYDGFKPEDNSAEEGQAKIDLGDWVRQLVPNPDLAENVKARIELIRKETDDTPELHIAQATKFSSSGEDATWTEIIKGMLLRSLLLSRIATGFCLSLIENSDVTSNFLRPWVDSIASRHGLVSSTDDIDYYSDLWSDVEQKMAAVNIKKDAKWFDLIQRPDATIPVLGQMERITAWSFSSGEPYN